MLALDDVPSAGGTMRVVLDALDYIGTDTVDTATIIKRTGLNGLDDSDHRAKAPTSATIKDGKVVIADEHGGDRPDTDTAAALEPRHFRPWISAPVGPFCIRGVLGSDDIGAFHR